MMNNVAMDIVVDSFLLHYIQENIRRKGIIFMSISEAIKEHPELVRKYLGTVIPQKTIIMQLNSAVFSDGSFCYIPRAFVAQWNFLLILESIKPVQDNLKELICCRKLCILDCTAKS
jgi:Fe-S cluster assembly scaffold protein SufB